MEPEIRLALGVYRRLDNRFEGLDDSSSRALELHNRRRAALHDVFDGKPIAVVSWGETDDTSPHEFVELVIGMATSTVFRYAVVPGLKFIGEKLAEAAVSQATSEAVKAFVSWLRGPQEEKKLLDFTITLPDGTTVSVDPPDRMATITVSFTNGRVESIKYSAANVAAG